MRFGLGHLRLAPAVLWRMTLIEYDAAVRGYLEAKGVKPGSGPMRRSRLEELMALYPDAPSPDTPYPVSH